MTLKAAYFSLIGHSETATITWPGHIRPAIDRGRASPFHIQWPNHEAGHNVRAWAELLIVERAQMPGAAYSTPFALQVQSCGQEIWDLWRVTLRYHKNRAYPFEVRQVREATTWLLTNSSQL